MEPGILLIITGATVGAALVGNVVAEVMQRRQDRRLTEANRRATKIKPHTPTQELPPRRSPKTPGRR